MRAKSPQEWNEAHGPPSLEPTSPNADKAEKEDSKDFVVPKAAVELVVKALAETINMRSALMTVEYDATTWSKAERLADNIRGLLERSIMSIPVASRKEEARLTVEAPGAQAANTREGQMTLAFTFPDHCAMLDASRPGWRDDYSRVEVAEEFWEAALSSVTLAVPVWTRRKGISGWTIYEMPTMRLIVSGLTDSESGSLVDAHNKLHLSEHAPESDGASGVSREAQSVSLNPVGKEGNSAGGERWRVEEFRIPGCRVEAYIVKQGRKEILYLPVKEWPVEHQAAQWEAAKNVAAAHNASLTASSPVSSAGGVEESLNTQSRKN